MRKRTFEARLKSANKRADAALGLFRSAAVLLEASAEKSASLAEEARNEADGLVTVANSADTSASAARSQAARLRELVGEE